MILIQKETFALRTILNLAEIFYHTVTLRLFNTCGEENNFVSDKLLKPRLTISENIASFIVARFCLICSFKIFWEIRSQISVLY